ncbi:sugar transferase [Microbispora tritici]|uniref:Sugar transferase n=2 Tax=Microbispora TaxID=2005 RepID=A0ABY3M4T7_9ACTN|nr:sugar transferase [Microbispora fusca]TYB67057.1 sugar transferase [Microbispora tritici]
MSRVAAGASRGAPGRPAARPARWAVRHRLAAAVCAIAGALLAGITAVVIRSGEVTASVAPYVIALPLAAVLTLCARYGPWRGPRRRRTAAGGRAGPPHAGPAGWQRLVKAVFDRLVATVALVVLAPLLTAVAIAVRVSGPGPALFRQRRVGRDGAEFTILKFRTTHRDAEARKVELTSDARGVLFKVRRDPRVTPLGALLRRYSIDELPQLLNVLRGDMSLVGPRPLLPEEVARYGGVRGRLPVRPGMTGLWQVNGRSDLSWEESVRLDLRYVENWSLRLDLQILWRTWAAVARGAGAY